MPTLCSVVLVFHPHGRPERFLAVLAASLLLIYALVAAWIVAGDRRPLPGFNATVDEHGSLVVEGAVAEPRLRDELFDQLAEDGDFDIIVSGVQVDADAGEIDSIDALVEGLLSQISSTDP